MDLLFGLFIVCVALNTEVRSSCMEARLCCQGRNNTCRASGPMERGARPGVGKPLDDQQHNSLHSILDTRPSCYCDSECVEIGDCCLDHAEYCPPRDCIVGEWRGWGECNEQCGLGIKVRTRPIVQDAQNGGSPCDVLEQQVRCEGQNCKVPRQASEGWLESRETARVIPASYGSWRTSKLYDPFQDIRRNLFDHRSAAEKIHRPNYCAKFEITRSSKGCSQSEATPWTGAMQEGATVCVECQKFAMKRSLGVRCRGHGVFERTTKWNALLSTGCYGEWVLKTRHEECTCAAENTYSFVLV